MLLRVTKRTRAQQVIKGLGILLVLAVISSWLNLSVINWMFSTLLQWMLLIIIIIFQPELRQMLEQLGRGSFSLRKKDGGDNRKKAEKTVDEIVRTAQNLSKRRVGALIVFQMNSKLDDICETGTAIDACISSMLLENIFEPNTPLHDGAVIIRDMRVCAAGCFLPLSENTGIDKKLGTRHRAALGISERTDAVALVVSEETGVISYTRGGAIHRYIDSRSLRELLESLFINTSQESDNWFLRLESQLRSLLHADKADCEQERKTDQSYSDKRP
jgi:TIGR00159 family protein